MAMVFRSCVLQTISERSTRTFSTQDGRIREEVLEARRRGVIFDIGHGSGSFGFRTAEAMLIAGFLPDVISSDVHALSVGLRDPRRSERAMSRMRRKLSFDIGTAVIRTAVAAKSLGD